MANEEPTLFRCKALKEIRKRHLGQENWEELTLEMAFKTLDSKILGRMFLEMEAKRKDLVVVSQLPRLVKEDLFACGLLMW
eukprot:c43060_g1_i1 orf=2-241(-)